MRNTNQTLTSLTEKLFSTVPLTISAQKLQFKTLSPLYTDKPDFLAPVLPLLVLTSKIPSMIYITLAPLGRLV